MNEMRFADLRQVSFADVEKHFHEGKQESQEDADSQRHKDSTYRIHEKYLSNKKNMVEEDLNPNASNV